VLQRHVIMVEMEAAGLSQGASPSIARALPGKGGKVKMADLIAWRIKCR
jgi:hypothetical protein